MSNPSTLSAAVTRAGETGLRLEDEETHERSNLLDEGTPPLAERYASSPTRVGLTTQWWKQPSAWWPVALIALFTLSYGMRLGPRVEVITMLVCESHKPKLNEDCKTDSIVQASVAKVTAVTALVTGVLGCLTVAWWGSISDRHGRARVIAATALGKMAQDINLIFTSKFHEHLPGGYWFLLVTAVAEGLCGGAFTGAAAAAMTAYITDCTDPASRSRFLSLFLGALYTGTSLGPTLGGLIMRITGSSSILIFYVTVFFDALFLLISWLVLPESLSSSQLLSAQQRINNETIPVWHSAPSVIQKFVNGAGHLLSQLTTPLKIFLPTMSARGLGSGVRTKDWRITLVVLSYFFAFLTSGSLTVRIQYMLARYGWRAEEVGYWLSISTGMRAVCLIFIVPYAMKYLKKTPPLEVREESRPPHDTTIAARHTAIGFDLALGRISLLIETLAYVSMPLAPTGMTFTAAKAFGSLGSGFQPAMQSIVLDLSDEQSLSGLGGMAGARGGAAAGRLFGAMSVVETLASQVVGPVLFGFVYVQTVAFSPAAALVAIALCFAAALGLLCCVRTTTPTRAAEGRQSDELLRV